MAPMQQKSSKTWTATVFIAGQVSRIEEELRDWCMRGACVTFEPCKYIYTGGGEDGVKIGLIQYPRFEKPEADLRQQALDLAHQLIEATNQLSCSVVMPDETVWIYRDEKEKSRLA